MSTIIGGFQENLRFEIENLILHRIGEIAQEKSVVTLK